MAFTFDSTIGGTSTNSYASVSEADEYFDSFLYSDDWDNQSATRKEKLLTMAWRSIDSQNFYGQKTNLSQNAEFPRYNLTDWDGQYITQSTIPQELKDAQCELANYLLENDQRYTGDGSETTNTESYNAGGISVKFRDVVLKDNLPNRVVELLRKIGPQCFKHNKRNRSIKL